MQQTQTYQLNKIDVDDNFSPVPLNENMDKVEAKFAALDGADAALDSRVTALEGHKVAVGSYTGSGSAQSPTTVHLGFRPKAVLIQEAALSGDCYMTTGVGTSNVTLTDTGFIGSAFFTSARTFSYIAIG